MLLNMSAQLLPVLFEKMTLRSWVAQQAMVLPVLGLVLFVIRKFCEVLEALVLRRIDIRNIVDIVEY